MRFRSLVMILAIVALADEAAAAGASYAPCTKTPTPSDLEGAKGLHSAAKQYLAKGAYDQAVQTWLAAYNFDCTKPEVFINIGKAYEGLGRVQDAVDAYQTYVDRKGPLADGATVLRLKALREELAAKQSASTEVSPATPEPVAPAATNAAPQTDSGTGAGPWPWVVVGTGGAVGIVGAALLGIGAGKVSDAENICPGRDCSKAPPGTDAAAVLAAQDDGNKGLTFQRAGVGLLAGGLAAAAGGVVWYLVAKPSAAATASLRVSPIVGAGTYGVSATLPF